MGKYLSIDTEATGLEEHDHLIQLAFVPVDAENGKILHELAKETLVKCPSFESLEPRLNSWVKKHVKNVICAAHKEGIDPKELGKWVSDYFEWEPIRSFFGKDKPVFLGKSLSALDIPILKRHLGEAFMMKTFHHHTVDVTSTARLLVDSKILPPGCASGSKLIKFFELSDTIKHTALSDAIDMGKIYLKMVERLNALAPHSSSNKTD